MTKTSTAKRPTSNAELIAVSLNSDSLWTVLSALLMREYGMAPMQARIKASKLIQGRGTHTAAELALVGAAREIVTINS